MTATADVRLEARETSKLVYATNGVVSVALGFLFAFLLSADGTLRGVWILLLPLVGIAFNATGFVRPKRLEFSEVGLKYRPVWGASVFLKWREVDGFGVSVVTSFGSGFITWKSHRSGVPWWSRRGNLGSFLEPQLLREELERRASLR